MAGVGERKTSRTKSAHATYYPPASVCTQYQTFISVPKDIKKRKKLTAFSSYLPKKIPPYFYSSGENAPLKSRGRMKFNPVFTKRKVQISEEPAAKGGGLGIRHLQALFLFLCILVNYLMRVNLSVGIVLMTDNETNSAVPTFDWSVSQQSSAQSAFFLGYFFMNLAAAVLVTRLNNKYLLLGSVTVSSLLTLLTPVLVIAGGYYVLIAIRFGIGLMQGFMMAVVMGQMSRWIPQSERGRCGALVLGGIHVGTIISFATSGYLGTQLGGWPAIFYFSGGLAAAWVVLWAFVGAERPSHCSYVSAAEKAFIEKEISQSSSVPKDVPIPWKAMLSSKACWAVAIVTLGHNWGYWTLVTEMPSYFKSVLKFSATNNGLISALPYACLWVVSFPASYTADLLIRKGITSVTLSRKICNTIGHWGAGVCLVILGYTEDKTIAITMFTIGVTLIGFTFIGYNINHLDILPNFAGLLMGLTNGLSNITSLSGPLFVGAVIKHADNADEWRIVFYVSAAIFFIGNAAFILMGTSEVQDFNEIPGEYEVHPPSRKQSRKVSISSIVFMPA